MGITKHNEKWKVDISSGVDNITGKRTRHIKKGFKTKAEAEAYEARFRIFELNKIHHKEKLSIDYLYSLMVQEDKAANKKMSYIITQKNSFNNYFREYFSKADMKKITYNEVVDFRDYLLARPNRQNGGTLSANSVNHQMVLLKKLLDIGVKRGYMEVNPSKMVKKLPVPKAVMKYYTAKEFKEFLTIFEDGEYSYKLFFKVLFFTGLRLGEALALTWEDINFEESYLMISKSIYYYKNEAYLGTPKNSHSIRKVYIHEGLINELKRWQLKQFALLKKYEPNLMNLQIYQDSPEPLSKYLVTNKKKQIDKRKSPLLKKIRIHDFRHSHASYLINNGIDPTKLSKRLGHSSITTTLDTYSHLYPDTQKSVVSIFDDFE
ncbi:tyrosine-type recombinase/integrase [Lactococcus lactis]|uniref:site-specific integrase n=2 Tax=Lactococcus lactis TaxID=1358 RepID=UPI0028FD2E9D|nr:putative defective protein IntQ [Lactococcus lactis]